MNYKKSMRIFWLSLCLLLISGTAIIAAVHFHADKKTEDRQDFPQKNADAPAHLETKADAETDIDASADAVQSQTQTTAGQTDQPVQESVRQTNGRTVNYLYELKVKNGYLEVYYYHTEQLFLHTGILYHVLTAEQKLDLQKGKYFQNEQDLYGYLESCTS